MSGNRTLSPARRRQLAATLMLLVIVTGLFGVASAADPGDLDPTFGEGGRVFGPNGRVHAIAAIPASVPVPQGTLVTAGCLYAHSSTCESLALARFTSDGRLDNGFGTSGGVVAHDLTPGSIDAGYAVAVQGSGGAAKFVVAGIVGNQMAVVRLNLNGTLDTSFSRDGIALLPGQRAVALAVDGENQDFEQRDDLLVAGRDGSNFVVARLKKDGALHESDVDQKWTVTTSFEGASSPSSLALSGDRLVVAGTVAAPDFASSVGLASDSSDEIALAAYDAGMGMPYPNFGADGKVVGLAGSAAALFADGDEIVVAGRRDDKFLTARFDGNGSLGWEHVGPVGAATGVVKIGRSDGEKEHLYISGRSNPNFSADSAEGSTESTDMVITRRLPNGDLDDSFGSNGVVVTDFGGFIDDATALTEHAGKPVIAGHTGRHSSRMALARFEVEKKDDVADIAVSVSAAPDPVRVGGNLVYTARVTNGGPNHAYNTKLEGSTDTQMTLVSAEISTGVCTISGERFNCDVAGLPAGRSATLTLVAVPTTIGTANLDWRTSTGSRDPASGNDSATSSTQVVRAPGKWSPTGSHLLPRSHHKAVVLEGRACLEAVPPRCGQALVVSGSSAELFDPVSRRWIPTGPPSVNHLIADSGNFAAGFTLTVLEDGRVLLVGGEDAPAIAEIYDPRTGAWRPTLGSLNDPRAGHVAVRLSDGRVLIAGGAHIEEQPGDVPGCPRENLKSAEIFDPKGESFTPTGAMLYGRGASHQATGTLLANGDVLVVGGHRGPDFDDRNTNTGPCRDPFAPPEVFDPHQGGWRKTGDQKILRANHTATRLPNGKVLVAGGRTSLEQITTPSVEIYDPKAPDDDTHMKGEWEGVPSMGSAREQHSAVALSNGTVLVTGGAGSDRAPNWLGTQLFPIFNTTEIYDGSRWGSGGLMTTPRFAHAMVAFPPGAASHCSAICGRILVTGGLVHGTPSATSSGAPSWDALVSADLYTLDPGIERLDPAEGPVTGGTRVAISGLSLAGATKVVFEGEPPLECGAEGSAKCWIDPELPDTKIYAISPPHLPPEKVHVTVKTEPELTSLKTNADLFTYGLGPGLPPLPGDNDLSGGEGTLARGPTASAPPAVPGGPTSSLGVSPGTQLGTSQGTPPGSGFFGPPQGIPPLAQNPAVVTAANSDLAASWTWQPALVTAPHASAATQREEDHPAPRYSFSVLLWGAGVTIFAAGCAVKGGTLRRRLGSDLAQHDRAVPAIAWTS